jgi:hypothetical protein
VAEITTFYGPRRSLRPVLNGIGLPHGLPKSAARSLPAPDLADVKRCHFKRWALRGIFKYRAPESGGQHGRFAAEISAR